MNRSPVRSAIPTALAAFLSVITTAVPARGQQQPAEEAPVYDYQVNLIYTVNNLGYTDTCG